MGLFDRLKSLLPEGKLNVDARYERLREAVTGTMSQFYMARDRKTDEVVGLKILDRDKWEQFEARFKGLEKPAEGVIACSLNHPRIVKTYSHGETNKGEPYLVTEYVAGPVLSALIFGQDERLAGKWVRLLRQMADALAAVHEAGYIHRDICPRNFICDKAIENVKLIDFGLTVPMEKQYMQPGNRTGTPNYLAPEIVRRRPTDQRVDVFALGVTAYQLCTYALPWPVADASGKAALRHDTEAADEITSHRPDINRKLAALIMQCIAVDPDDRPPTSLAVARALASVHGDLEE